MKTSTYTIIPAWITLFSFFIAGCQKSSPDLEPVRDDKLQTILDQTLSKYNGKGVSATIIFDEHDFWSGTSGIYNVTDNPDLWEAVFNEPARCWSPAEILAEYLEEPYADPGSGWYYSNTNFLLLGMILREATGSEVSALLRDRFF